MALSLSQVQKQTQRLIMTPQMQQSIQLLQMNSMELEQLARQEMLENPYLDLGLEETDPEEGAEEAEANADEEPETRDSAEDTKDENEPEQPGDDDREEKPDEAADDRKDDERREEEEPSAEESPVEEEEPEKFDEVDADWEDYFDGNEPLITSHASTYEHPEDETDFSEYTARKVSLQEQLAQQLANAVTDDELRRVGDYIVDNINDDGYLELRDVDDERPFDIIRQDPDEPVRLIAEDLGVEEALVIQALGCVQEFEPVGVGARNLAECLRLQLEDQEEADRLPYRILDHHFDLFMDRKFRDLARELDVTEEEARRAFERLARLEPRPGRSVTTDTPHYIRPDVYVKDVGGRYVYFLNEGDAAHLKINEYYRSLLRNHSPSMSDKEREYAVEKYKSALWLIKNIEKRKSTILNVTEAIMDYQQEFLDKGVEHLRPLTLKVIAEQVGMHESTIARVTSSKYVETPRGTFPLKFFFSSSLDTESGESASSRSIKQMIHEIVDGEDPKKPMSDQKIATILVNRGIHIARRTVAKYREQMKILPAKLRKAV